MNHNRKIFWSTAFFLLWLGILNGCSTPSEPPEVRLVEIQGPELWRADANIYAPDEYSSYKIALRKGKDLLIKENSRFAWFRDYEPVRVEFRSVLALGEQIQKKIQLQKELKAKSIILQLSYLKNRIETLKKLSTLINEGRIARKDITIADVLLKEADNVFNKGRYPDAEEKLTKASSYLNLAIEVIFPILNRYAESDQIKKWRTWVDETIRESGEKGGYAIVVSKVDKLLILYKNGKPYKSYLAGVGINGTKDKLYAGDRATPEGEYRIVKKIFRSRFHKALLINYPNEDDRRQFKISKKKGIIPDGIGIGGLIEIHGGGSNVMTYGCIALGNNEIDELFSMVDVNTPVTIVGAVDYENSISLTMKEL